MSFQGATRTDPYIIAAIPVVTTYAYDYDDHRNWVVLTETQHIEGVENNVVVRKREPKYFYARISVRDERLSRAP
jgi:hypothetical protein